MDKREKMASKVGALGGAVAGGYLGSGLGVAGWFGAVNGAWILVPVGAVFGGVALAYGVSKLTQKQARSSENKDSKTSK
jgi:outer membrane lipoprotein SlyB